jgi:polar amino acid transport system substrate-binding protein
MMTMLNKNSRQRAVHAIVSGAFLMTLGATAGFAQDMPTLPTTIAGAGEVRVGTKCDYPPEGFMNNAGVPIGVEVSMAHEIAKYAFGEEAQASIVCVTSANRVAALVGDKIDIIIATMGITPSRAEVVDFTQPYAWASQGMLVRAQDNYNSVAELDGHPVAFVKGALSIPYFEENYPGVERMQLDGVSDSIQVLTTGRVEGYAHDTPVLLTLAANNPKLRLIDEQFRFTLRAAAVRKGETEWTDYVNASLDRMAKEGKFREWFEEFANDDNLEVKLNFWDMSAKPE